MAQQLEMVAIRHVPFDRPWDWLAAGWRDLWQQPSISLFYGIAAVVMGLLLSVVLLYYGLESMIPVAAGGFLLVGPMLAVGLYEKSRRLHAGRAVTLQDTISAAWRSLSLLAPFMAVLLLIYFLWMRIAFLLFGLFLGTGGLPPARDFMSTLLFTSHGLGLLVTGTATGAMLAAAVFALSAVSVPMLTERKIDAVTAMVTSVRAVIANPQPMLLWAALVAGFIALGIATIGAGLVLAFPLVGHATWHAYRDLAGAP